MEREDTSSFSTEDKEAGACKQRSIPLWESIAEDNRSLGLFRAGKGLEAALLNVHDLQRREHQCLGCGEGS